MQNVYCWVACATFKPTRARGTQCMCTSLWFSLCKPCKLSYAVRPTQANIATRQGDPQARTNARQVILVLIRVDISFLGLTINWTDSYPHDQLEGK
jgi:hypothetical protein